MGRLDTAIAEKNAEGDAGATVAVWAVSSNTVSERRYNILVTILKLAI